MPHDSDCRRMSRFCLILIISKTKKKKKEGKFWYQTPGWHLLTARVMGYFCKLTNKSTALTQWNVAWKCSKVLQQGKGKARQVVVVYILKIITIMAFDIDFKGAGSGGRAKCWDNQFVFKSKMAAQTTRSWISTKSQFLVEIWLKMWHLYQGF